MELFHIELELGGCNNEVAALQSDCYTEIPNIFILSSLSRCQVVCGISVDY